MRQSPLALMCSAAALLVALFALLGGRAAPVAASTLVAQIGPAAVTAASPTRAA